MGGKRLLRKQIIELMPRHTCYVEIFVGTSWVFFGNEPSKAEIINDLDSELINFYQIIKENHQDFIDAFDWHLILRYDRPHTLFYLDPPYVGSKQHNHNFAPDQHRLLADLLRALKGKFILTYNDCRFVRGLYKGFKMRPTKVRYMVTRAVAGARRPLFSTLSVLNDT